MVDVLRHPFKNNKKTKGANTIGANTIGTGNVGAAGKKKSLERDDILEAEGVDPYVY